MHDIERRAFMQGAAIGALAFTVGGAEVLLTPRAARAQGVPLRTLTAAQAATLDALGETLVPGARQAGISHFVDQQISIPAEEALLEARILNVRPPYANFYRAALGAVDRASQALNNGRPELDEIIKNNIFFDTCVYHQPGINLLSEVVPVENILFASEMIGAVRGIDPTTGHYYDDTKRYIEASTQLSAEQRYQVYEGNVRRVFPRLDAALKAKGK